MNHNARPISPLLQRMIEDMALRKLSPRTQAAYVRAVVNLQPLTAPDASKRL
jgi:integrase/recombinase XerD